MIPDISRKPALLKKKQYFPENQICIAKSRKAEAAQAILQSRATFCRFEFNPLWFTIRRFANCGSQSSHNKKLRNFL